MKTASRFIVGLLSLALLFGCASQEEAPPEIEEQTADEVVQLETTPADVAVEEPEPEPDPLEQVGIAGFETGDGVPLENGQSVTLPTGGPVAGRLVPASTNPDVTLYVSRDGSVPSAEQNWGGPIDPAAPRQITGTLEATARYVVVAELDGGYSAPFGVTVSWEHEADPAIAAPQFLVDGQVVSGSIQMPTSDGSDPDGRLGIRCNYLAATLYITRDGSEPSEDNYWKSQVCDGTYIFSPADTAADYRVVAVWQGVASDPARLAVEWVEPK